jgi:glycosyltransferase involved in cell wall biosynthesis
MSTIALDARLFDGMHTGDSTYWSCLIRALAELPTQERFLLYSNRPKPENIPDRPNFHWIQLAAKSSRWWSLVSFPLAARKAGASCLHTQYSLSPLAGSIGMTTVHDVSFLIEPAWFSQKDRTLLTLSVRSAAKRARAILAVSETGKNEIEAYLPAARGKTTVTYNACPPWIARKESGEARAEVLSRFGIERPYLLTLGTRWARKNMELAVQAASALRDDDPHLLIVAGKGQWSGSELGSRGRAVGYVPNEALGTLYSGASLYLAPSRHEGFGIPLLEAFRCGCPVLCSSGGAFPEVAGGAAIVEPGWAPSEWSATMEGLLGDSSKLKSLSQAGVQREKAFTWTETALRTLDVYSGFTRDGRQAA